MIKVEGPDPGVLNRRMRHHVEDLRPLIDALTYSILFESSFARDDEVHVIRQSRPGPGSFAFLTASGEEYHFRMSSTNRRWIDVRDSYQDSKIIKTLRTDDEARRFIRKVSKANRALLATP